MEPASRARAGVRQGDSEPRPRPAPSTAAGGPPAPPRAIARLSGGVRRSLRAPRQGHACPTRGGPCDACVSLARSGGAAMGGQDCAAFKNGVGPEYESASDAGSHGAESGARVSRAARPHARDFVHDARNLAHSSSALSSPDRQTGPRRLGDLLGQVAVFAALQMYHQNLRPGTQRVGYAVCIDWQHGPRGKGMSFEQARAAS